MAAPSSVVTAVVDCVLVRRTRVPRDRSGRPVSASGISILVAATRHLGLPDLRWERDAARRWFVADLGLHASVSHGDRLAVAAFTPGAPIGIDLQEIRDRPAALGWLATVIGRTTDEPASIREFCECEALIKASTITKETFLHIPLPPWRPGSRPLPTGHWVTSGRLDDHHEFALVTAEPVGLRWSRLDQHRSPSPPWSSPWSPSASSSASSSESVESRKVVAPWSPSIPSSPSSR